MRQIVYISFTGFSLINNVNSNTKKLPVFRLLQPMKKKEKGESNHFMIIMKRAITNLLQNK